MILENCVSLATVHDSLIRGKHTHPFIQAEKKK